MDKLVLIGAGGHSLSVYDSIDRNKYEFIGYVDELKEGEYHGRPIFGKRPEDVPDYKDCCYIVCIGDVPIRERLYHSCKKLGLRMVNIIDKSAYISPSAKIGDGNFIGKSVIINAGTEIENNNLINTRSLIEHECRIGSHTNISTNSVLNGDVIVGDGAYFGSCAACNGQIMIGEYSVVGSGAIVTKNVESHTTVVGIPAKVIKRYGVPV